MENSFLSSRSALLHHRDGRSQGYNEWDCQSDIVNFSSILENEVDVGSVTLR